MSCQCMSVEFCHVVSVSVSRHDRVNDNHNRRPALPHDRFLREVLFFTVLPTVAKCSIATCQYACGLRGAPASQLYASNTPLFRLLNYDRPLPLTSSASPSLSYIPIFMHT
jgi:hypothetical protein